MRDPPTLRTKIGSGSNSEYGSCNLSLRSWTDLRYVQVVSPNSNQSTNPLTSLDALCSNQSLLRSEVSFRRSAEILNQRLFHAKIFSNGQTGNLVLKGGMAPLAFPAEEWPPDFRMESHGRGHRSPSSSRAKA